MKYFFMFIFLCNSFLFALNIDTKTSYNDLLVDAKIYKDHSRSENIRSIQKKKFKNEASWSFGYSPKFDVWIKFTLTNKTPHTIEKILEYDNPLSSYVDFYEGEVLVKKDGLLSVSEDRSSLDPIFKVRVKAYESKVFFIKTSSTITTLIIKLNLWSTDAFKSKEIKHQLILALFFGAMGIIIFYNFIIFLATKERSYLYYVLFFVSISFHHLMYKGVVTLFVSSEVMEGLIANSSFIVAMPMLFLALFTKHILDLKQYPRLNKTLNYILILYLILIVVVMFTNQHQYRSIFLMFVLFSLLYMTIYALVKRNKQAYFIIGGLGLFMTSGLFMYLSSSGVYDIYRYVPYYIESSLVLEIMLFSLALASKIKMLTKEKVKAEERKVLLKDLNHRVQNNMQTILSFITLQRDEVLDKNTDHILTSLENRILATSELYALLEVKGESSIVDIRKYFFSITDNLQKSFKRNEITVEINSIVSMNSEYAKYCGLIVNETVTNSFKYAFKHTKSGKIKIELEEKEKHYFLSISDNGSGFKEKFKNSSGMNILDTLVSIQLEGTLNIKQENGTKIEIEWRKNDR